MQKTYEPFEYFSTKKKNSEKNTNDLKTLWNEFNDKKKLKYIKKAEKSFDEDHQCVNLSHSNCFSTYLSNEELKLLMQSYNCPNEIPQYD